MSKEVYRVHTAHRTQVFLDSRRTLLHRDPVMADNRLNPVYARHLKDGGLTLFTIRDNRFNYIKTIDERGKVTESDSPVVLGRVENKNGSLSIAQGKRYWSARRENGSFSLMPRKARWEHLTLDKAEFELTREYIPPLVKNFEPEEDEPPQRSEWTTSGVVVPAISVIIPMYNTEDYVEECLTSVLNQTFTDYEVIVVDDCSTDRSAEVVENMIPKFGSKLKLIRRTQNNGEPGTPRNIGVNAAIGKYIYFMDSDDIIKNDALEKLYTTAELYHADIVYADKCSYLDTEGKVFRTRDWTKITEVTFKVYDITQRLRDFAVDWVYTSSPCRRFYLRSFWVTNEIFFPATHYKEDTFASLQYCINARRYIFLPEPFYFYRMRHTSLTHTMPPIRDALHTHVNIIDDMFSPLNKLMSNSQGFLQHPEFKSLIYRYFFNFYLKRGWSSKDKLMTYYQSNHVGRLYGMICSAFERGIIFSEPLIAYCVVASIIQSDQITAQNRQIEKLRNELEK